MLTGQSFAHWNLPVVQSTQALCIAGWLSSWVGLLHTGSNRGDRDRLQRSFLTTLKAAVRQLHRPSGM